MPPFVEPGRINNLSPIQRQRLHARLRRLAHLSPYLAILLLPGSVLLLPAYAWWMHRRRQRRRIMDAAEASRP